MSRRTCGTLTKDSGRCANPVGPAGKCAAGHHAARYQVPVGVDSPPMLSGDTLDPFAVPLTRVPEPAMSTGDVAQAAGEALVELQSVTNGQWVCDDYDLTADAVTETLAHVHGLADALAMDAGWPSGVQDRSFDVDPGVLRDGTIRELVQQGHEQLKGAVEAAGRLAASPFPGSDKDGYAAAIAGFDRAQSFLVASVIAERANEEAWAATRAGTSEAPVTMDEQRAAATARVGRELSDAEMGLWSARLRSAGVDVQE